jgi:hypothetical protein
MKENALASSVNYAGKDLYAILDQDKLEDFKEAYNDRDDFIE